MTKVSLRGLRKTYSNTVAVAGVDLDIEEGELIVLLGPSGCGKSTTLRMVAGLETITSGQVRIAGRDVTAHEPKDRDIAMVFQNYALYPQKTIRDNMAFGLRMRGMATARISERVDQAARMLDIAQLLDRKPRQLSGGQMQRVALGRALVRDPAVFLLDEPLSNLDAKLRARMREEIALLQRHIGKAMLYVTHDQTEAMTLADRIVIMRAGHVQQIGSPLEVYDRPANTFVAGFIGSPEMNLAPATLEAGRLKLAGNVWLDAPAGVTSGPVTAGIRPEALQPSGAGAPFSIEGVEQLGSQTLVIGTLGDQRMRILTGRRDDLAVGESLFVTVSAAMIHLFDPHTGDRLARSDKL